MKDLTRTAAGGLTSLLAAVFICLIAVVSMARADFVGHGAPVRDVALSADGQFAATAGFDDLAILWDVASREQLVRFYGHEAGVNAVAFLPPALGSVRPRVVTVSDDGTARIWDGDTGLNLAILDGHTKKVVGVATSSDGTRIATASWDRSVRLWDAETGEPLEVFEAHKNSVNAVRFLPNDAGVVSAGYDGDVRVWPLDGSQEPYRFAKIGFPINAIALSGDGTTLVTGSADQTVRVWDMASRDKIQELAGFHDGAVLAVAISQDGQQIASGGVGGALHIWETGSQEPRVDLEVEHYRAVWAMTFSPDGERLYAAGVDSVVRAWNALDGESLIGETTRFQPVARVSSALARSDSAYERGSFQFRKCAICHSLTDDGVDRSGPSLANLFGREAGTWDGYVYSDALTGTGIVWTDETVDRLFDIGPNQMFPGTKMPEQRLTTAQDRQDLVEFLKEATAD